MFLFLCNVEGMDEKSVFINLSVPVVKYITRCGVCKICNAYVNTN